MKLLITGASGFVGTAMADKSIRRGLEVKAAMRSSRQSVSGAEVCVVSEIDGESDWTHALKDVNTVIHLAARVHVLRETVADPQAEFLKVNLYGTENLARQAAHAGVKRLVYVSSIGVNGNATFGLHAYSESDSPHPHNAYADSKWQAEQALWKISQQTGLEIVVVRPPLVYGGGAPGNFSLMLKALTKSVPLPLASVSNLRSLVYVENLVDALILCATHPFAAGQTYLVSDGEDISTPGLLRQLGDAIECPARLFPCPPALLKWAGALTGRSAQVERLMGSLQVDSGKIRRELNWTPPYTLQQGLQATAEWYRNAHL